MRKYIIAMIVLVGSLIAATSFGESDGSFGTLDHTGFGDQSDPGYISFVDGTFAGTTGATLDSIEFYATYGVATTTVVVGLYSDNSGPNTRQCYGSGTYTEADNGYNAISSFTGTTTLTNGTTYWIAAGGDEVWAPFVLTGQASGTGYYITYSDPAPADASTATAYTWDYAFRAYYTNPSGEQGSFGTVYRAVSLKAGTYR